MKKTLIAAGAGAAFYFMASGLSPDQDLTDLKVWREKVKTWTHFWATYYGVEPLVAEAQFYQESRNGEVESVRAGYFKPLDIAASASFDGLSWGIAQMKPSTAADMDPELKALTKEQIIAKLNASPEYAIKLGCKYIAWCGTYLVNHTPLTKGDSRYIMFRTKAYNQGIGKTKNVILGVDTDSAGAINYWNKVNNRLKLLQAQS